MATTSTTMPTLQIDQKGSSAPRNIKENFQQRTKTILQQPYHKQKQSNMTFDTQTAFWG